MRLAAGLALTIAFGFVFWSAASAQGPDVQIAELDCNSDPELVVIANVGDEAQELEGWRLQSDPPETQSFDLRKLGAQLPPGVSDSIQSGAAASGAFVWTKEFVFRDDDHADYARLVDDAGVVVQQVDCAATPGPSPAGDVPNGGGPPPLTGGAVSPGLLMVVGASLLSGGLATFALSWLPFRRSRRREPVPAQDALAATLPEPTPRPRRPQPTGARASLLPLASGIAVTAMMAAAALLVWSRAGHPRPD